jgi:GGDEF domain-containing protein
VVPLIVIATLAGVTVATFAVRSLRRRRVRRALAAVELEASLARVVAEQQAAEHREQVLATLEHELGDVETELAIIRLVREALTALDPARPYELHLVDRFDPELVLRFATGDTPADAPERTSPWLPLAAETATTVVYHSTDVDGLCPHLAARLVEHCSVVCVPLLPMGRFGGVLYAMGPEGQPPPVAVIETYETMARLAGTALAMVRAFGTTARTHALPPAGEPVEPTEIVEPVDLRDPIHEPAPRQSRPASRPAARASRRPAPRTSPHSAPRPAPRRTATSAAASSAATAAMSAEEIRRAVLDTQVRVRPVRQERETVIDVREWEEQPPPGPERDVRDARAEASDPALEVITGLRGVDAAVDEIELLRAGRVPYAAIGIEIDHCDSYRGWHSEAVYHQAMRLLTDSALLGIHSDSSLFAIDTGRFVAVLPRVSAHSALTIASRIREDIARACRNGRTPTFTVCFGIVQGHPRIVADDVLDAIDDALADAQSRGIDRAVVNVGLQGGAAASTARGAAL